MDPIANMIIMLKNASRAGRENVSFPYSKLKEAIALCLKKEGFVSAIEKKARKTGPVLEVTLVYAGKVPKISDVERVSKQSRRVYFGLKEIHSVKSGAGVLVLSTPKGILSGKEARKEQVGGEALFKIW